MPNWITITLDDIYDAKLAPYVDALRTKALKAGQADPTPAIIQEVVDRVRAEVAGCERNTLDDDITTIPKDLKALAKRLVLVDMKARLEEPLTEDERRQNDKDIRYLERVADCKVPVAAPDNPEAGAEIQTGGGVQILRPSSTTTHPFGRLGTS